MATIVMGAGKIGADIDKDFTLSRAMFRRRADYTHTPNKTTEAAWKAAIKALEDFRGEKLSDEEK